jgi:antirestriction protein ArdC
MPRPPGRSGGQSSLRHLATCFRLIGDHFRQNRAIVTAASHAQRAADFVNGLQPGSGG